MIEAKTCCSVRDFADSIDAISILSKINSKEAVDSIAIAGNEGINFRAEPVHAGQLKNEPQRKTERDFFEHPASCGKADIQSFVGEDMDLPHHGFMFDLQVALLKRILIVKIDEFNTLKPVQCFDEAPCRLADDAVSIEEGSDQAT